MIWQIVNILFPVFSIVAVGYLYARRHAPDMAAANTLNIDVFVPALVFSVLTGKSFDLTQYQALTLGGIAVILGPALVAWAVARMFGYSFKTFAPPMMFNNSGNMGLPLMLLAFGEQMLPAAVVLFIIENTLHFTVGVKILDPRASLRGLFRIPIFIATLAGLTLSLLQIHLPVVIATPIEMLGQICIPLMLFALGVRLIHIDWADWKIGLVGAVTAPLSGLIFALPAIALLDLPRIQAAMLVVFAALPPAVLNYMMAERYGQQPRQVASIVMLGNLASVVVMPVVLALVL